MGLSCVPWPRAAVRSLTSSPPAQKPTAARGHATRNLLIHAHSYKSRRTHRAAARAHAQRNAEGPATWVNGGSAEPCRILHQRLGQPICGAHSECVGWLGWRLCDPPAGSHVTVGRTAAPRGLASLDPSHPRLWWTLRLRVDKHRFMQNRTRRTPRKPGVGVARERSGRGYGVWGMGPGRTQAGRCDLREGEALSEPRVDKGRRLGRQCQSGLRPDGSPSQTSA